MRLAGYQPQYFPRLHYFARMLASDVFAIADYLQYVRKHSFPTPQGLQQKPSHQAHTPVKSGSAVLLLDVPVRRGGIEGKQPLNEARLDYSFGWRERNLNSIHHEYFRAPQYERIFPSLSLVMIQRYDSLAELNIESILWALGILFEMPMCRPKGPTLANIQARLPFAPYRLKKIVRMSETTIPPADKKERDANDWLVETCHAFGADEYYYGGTGAAAYMDFGKFERARITLRQQEWTCREYPQLHGAFIPNLSIIDLLMNVPPAEARAILHTPEETL